MRLLGNVEGNIGEMMQRDKRREREDREKKEREREREKGGRERGCGGERG
jgi:hypothetical protein